MSARLPELADRAEIQDLNARFAWALDLREYDELQKLFTTDAHYVSLGREFFDRQSLVDSFKARGGTRTTRHGLGNLLITFTGSGSATGKSSWHTFASNSEISDGVDLYMVADFDDVYELVDGTWLIKERIITPIFRRNDLAPAANGATPGKES